jgi:hypothetical protein
MDGSSPDALASVLADLSSAAKDEHEQASQDEQDAAFEVLGDHLTANGYAAWQREHGAGEGSSPRSHDDEEALQHHGDTQHREPRPRIKDGADEGESTYDSQRDAHGSDLQACHPSATICEPHERTERVGEGPKCGVAI